MSSVFIVDDDPGIRYSLSVLLETAQLATRCYDSAEAFLAECGPRPEGCLLLDVRMPGMGGVELQAELRRRQIFLPIIFLTAHADLQTGVEAVKQGAMDFLTKPVNGALLLQRITVALDKDRQQGQTREARRLFRERLLKVTGREREVLALALAGMSNKDIALQLQVSLRTIEGHRSRIFLRTGVASLLELARLAAKAGLGLDEIDPFLADN